MTKLLISFVKKKKSNNYRSSISVMSGIVCILCNILLCITKFVVGSLTGSVSITADALNNLSDASSNIVTIVSTKLADKPVDEEHPFGHGRIEYISALIVAFLIFLMGFELGKSSIEKIIHPTAVESNFVFIAIIVVAILVKLWMSYFNKKLYQETDNINLKAVSQDSLNDCISTGATIVSMVVCKVFGIAWFDGAVGLFVSAFIIFSGVGIVKEILGPLLGQPPEKELVDGIKDIMLSEELIIGVHDLIVHDYGPGRIIASAHAEVPSNVDVLAVHDVIDNVEHRINKELNIIICIHMDPIVVDDEEVDEYRQLTDRLLKGYNDKLSFHDFRMVKGETHTNLIFDIVVPLEEKLDNSQLEKEIKALFKKENELLCLVLTIEHPFV